MSWEEDKKIIQNIEGLISEKEAKFLYELAQKCEGNIVEIGSWKGKSTVALSLGLKKKGGGGEGRVFAIDPHQGIPDSCAESLSYQENTEPTFRQNITQAEVDDIVIPMVMTSEEANKRWEAPISLLWIDGAHDYENVKKDFLLWEPHLKEGAIICFHDAFFLTYNPYPGVRTVVSEYIMKSDRFVNLNFCHQIVSATKVKRMFFGQKILKLPKLFIWYSLPIVHFLVRHLVSFLIKIKLKKIK